MLNLSYYPIPAEVHMAVERRVIKTAEAARRLNVSLMTITRWYRAGLLQGYKTSPARNAHLYIYVDSIVEFMHATGRPIPADWL